MSLLTLKVANKDIITRIQKRKMRKCMDRLSEVIISRTNTSITSELLHLYVVRSTRQERRCKKVFL